MRILLLGGTSEARDLAARLVDAGYDVTSSLAGRVARPRLPVGPVRIGGFGGVEGLRHTLAAEGYDTVIDATHPFAQGMSANASYACAVDGVALLRLERPGWGWDPRWHYASGHDDAAILASGLGVRPFLTVGRQELARFVGPLAQHRTLARVVDVPDVTLPTTWTLLSSRGPYTLDGELDLMTSYGIDVLVTKDSGGAFTWPKMEAANKLDIPIVVVRRPVPRDGVITVNAVADAVAWISARGAGTPPTPPG